METTEKKVENTTQKLNSPTTENLSENTMASRPLRSLKPMKSMMRVKSFKPQKIELSRGRRRIVKF